MSFPRDNQEEMSMEDILSSIRKYVSEGDDKSQVDQQQEKEACCSDEKVVELSESYVVHEDDKLPVSKVASVADIPINYEEVSTLSKNVFNEKGKMPGPFDQLTNALNAYGKNKSDAGKQSKVGLTVDQLFSSIAEKVIEKWVDENLRSIAEGIVLREIEKIKAEG
jgi:cell pole-organizing protein PopZ